MANRSTCERPGPEEVLGECVSSLVLSHHNENLKQLTSITALGLVSVTALGQTSVTALCYTSVLFRKPRKIYPWGVKACQPKRREEERETPGPLTPLFICFSPPPGLPDVSWASLECCLFCLRFSLWSSALPLFCFHGLFPSLSFSHRHSVLLFPILTT